MAQPNQQIDFQHIIHPYSNPLGSNTHLWVKKTRQCYLYLQDNKKLIDGMSSWWSAIHGYNHPKMVRKVGQQLKKMPHVMFGGLTHQPAIKLAKKLVDITPQPLQKVFFADSGSVAVEVAMKIALQYWQSKGENRTKFLTVENGYHGDTFGAMSVTDPINSMHKHFKGFLGEQLFAQKPQLSGQEKDDSDLENIKKIIEKKHPEIAAVIIEPIVQGAGGMRIYRKEYLEQLKNYCQQYNILLIYDEIATGFGRTGELFACHHSKNKDGTIISPDILCLGKALTGGMMTLSATLITEKIAQIISQGNPGLIMHGPTFMANPLACSCANASVELLLSGNYQWQNKVKSIEQQFNKELLLLKNHPAVEDVRVLGAIGVVECKDTIDNTKIIPILLDYGVWLRPFGKLLYTMPPYTIQSKQLTKICETMKGICDFQRKSH